MNSFPFRIASSPQPRLAFTNRVYVSKNDFMKFAGVARTMDVSIHPNDPSVNINIGQFVFLARYVCISYSFILIEILILCVLVNVSQSI
jgi:hypothetical protein